MLPLVLEEDSDSDGEWNNLFILTRLDYRRFLSLSPFLSSFLF